MSLMIDLPSPFCPREELLASLRTLEALPQDDEAVRGSLQILREAIAHRQANPLPRGGKPGEAGVQLCPKVT